MSDILIVKQEPQLLLINTQEPSRLSILTAGQQGPQGVAGVSGAASIPNVLSGSNLSGHRLVYLDSEGNAQYASASNRVHAGRVVGVTTSASVTGGSVEILTMGKFSEPSWNFDISLPIYLGEEGTITQIVPTRPTSAFLQVVGYVISPNKIYIQLQTPILLN